MAYLPSGVYIDPTTQEVAAALAWLSGSELERIVSARGVDVSRTGQRDETLRRSLIAAQLTSAAEIGTALQLLSQSELTVLRVLWRSGALVRASSIAPAFGKLLSDDRLHLCLRRLQDLALLLPSDRNAESVFIPSSVRAALLGRSGAARPAAYVYESLTSETLATVSTGMGLVVERKRKADRLAAVVAALQDEAAVRTAIASLPEATRKTFDLIAQSGGTMDGWRLAQKVPDAGASGWGYSGYDLRLRRDGASTNSVMQLQERGLLAPFPGEYATTFTICDEVLTALLPPLQVSPADFIEPEFASPPNDARPAGANPAPLLDLAETLHFIEEAPIALTQKSLFPRPQSKRLARQLSVADPAFADLLVALALQSRLVENDGVRLRVRPKQAGGLLQRSELVGRAALFETWKELRGWRNDRGEGIDRGEAGVKLDAGDRTVLLALLAELPAAGATVDSVATRLWSRAPFRFGALRPEPAAGEDRLTPLSFVLGALRSLAWLGLAERLDAPGRSGAAAETVGLRLTPAGRALLQPGQAHPDATVPRTDRIIVQPTLDVLVPPNAEPALYGALRRFTESRGAAGMRTLTLTAGSLRRAFDADMTPQQIRDLLQRHADAPLPATVAALLTEVHSRHGRIHVGPAAFYLTVDDPHLLVELQSDKRLAGLVERTLAPTVALVREQSLPAILERLRGAGHMPVGDVAAIADSSRVARTNGAAPVRRPLNLVTELAAAGDIEDVSIEATAKTHGSDAIREVLQEAIKQRAVVEIEYRGKVQGVEQRSVRDLEVNDIFGDVVLAFCKTKMGEREFKLERILWARLTGDHRRTRRPQQ